MTALAPPPSAPTAPSADAPQLQLRPQPDGSLTLVLSGRWRLQAELPELQAAQAALAQARGVLRLQAEQLSGWDGSAPATLWGLMQAARAQGLAVDDGALPPDLRGVLALAQPRQATAAPAPAPAAASPASAWHLRLFTRVGHIAWQPLVNLRDTLAFVGDFLVALIALARGRARMRGFDLTFQVDQTGPRSLGIVSLISFLVGLILAYMGAAQLQRFGAQIYIADLVTIGMVREIAALMTAIILAGRVGAAFAAQLGTMQANEEIDALQAMGLPPMEHLVLPRVLALTLVAPLLTAYAGAVGVAAGAVVATLVFDITPREYLHQSLDALTLTHAAVGLFKGTVYAALVGLAGCRQGLHAGRSAQAVGDATTQAVVQAIVWIVVAASAITVAFQRVDI
jgi:phospholipid/cholesterol/gamma-HCH transport system permease protein